MSQINVNFGTFTVGGPFAYFITKNGDGVKVSTGHQTLNAMWDAIKADLGTGLSGETVTRGAINIDSKPS